MSQYSISLKSIINIKSHFNNNDDVFADTRKKIERGRELFFNFDYEGDAEFKNLFEDKFMINYLDESIYTLDADTFILALENDVKTKAPIFYKKYLAINELKNDIILGSKHITDRELNEEHADTAKSSTKATSSGTGKSKTSQFPQDIVDAPNFGSINYMDAGNASETSNKSDSTNQSDGSGTAKNVEHTEVTEITDALARIERYTYMQLDIISDFVRSFNDLFMRIW